jgi:hypothetical protein
MAVTLPNINEWVHDFAGRLMPFNWAKLIWRLMTQPTRSTRMPLMGVIRKHRSTPVGAALALAVIADVREFHAARGTREGELSWILEDNHAVRNLIETTGAKIYKTYRIYEKALA